jgi:hypothetical protein
MTIEPISAKVVILGRIPLYIALGTLIHRYLSITHLDAYQRICHDVLEFGVAIDTGYPDNLLPEPLGEVDHEQDELGVVAAGVDIEDELRTVLLEGEGSGLTDILAVHFYKLFSCDHQYRLPLLDSYYVARHER